MKLGTFNYTLPEKLIAQKPLIKRDQARLMVIDRKTGKIVHDTFSNVGQYLPPNSLIVLNDSKVVHARLLGRKERSEGQVEVFLLNKRDDGYSYETLMRPLKRIKNDDTFVFNGGAIKATVIDRDNRIVRFNRKNITQFLEQEGHIPLPPYIKRKDTVQDRKYYQTVYADKLGSVASPTAGLHFTNLLLRKLKEQGHDIEKVTLHINYGTFKPIEEENILDHKMHSEEYSLTARVASRIKNAKSKGQAIVAIGTTSSRVLETYATLKKFHGATNLFIYPGFEFKLVDILLTNFHLPLSSLLMLVYGFGGIDLMKKAYKEAINEKYRFYSYGDAMMII